MKIYVVVDFLPALGCPVFEDMLDDYWLVAASIVGIIADRGGNTYCMSSEYFGWPENSYDSRQQLSEAKKV